MNDTQPFFSILIPSFNRPGFLAQAIESIIANTCKDYEIIVSDDRSSKIDEIKRAIIPFEELIRFIEQPRNLGMSDNWNYLVEQARGKFVLIMGDDDLLLKKTLSRLKQYILEYPNNDLFAFGFNIIEENNLLICTRKPPTLFEISCDYEKILSELLIFGVIPFWTFHQFTICYRREIGQKIKYNKEAQIGSDLLFLVECMNAGKKLLVIPEVLFSWRKIQKEDNRGVINLSKDSINNIKSRSNIIKILRKQNNLHPIIKGIVFNKQFEESFFLDAVVLDNSRNKQEIVKYFEHDSKIVDAINILNKHYLKRFEIRITQFKKYICIFGFTGLFYILWYAWQRIYNKIHSRNIKY